MTRRPVPSLRGLLIGLLAIVLLLAATLSLLTVLQIRTATERTAAERQRVTSFRLSDGMRQSSNDLTRMVRLYVTTAEPRYRRYYDQILDIRGGRIPRPVRYDSSFWDRVMAEGEDGVEVGPAASLTELMRRAHFAPEEFDALRASLRTSDELAELELRVMRRVERQLAAGTYGAAARSAAYAQMVDDNYHHEKGRIMAAIDRFTALVDARTARGAAELQARTDQLLVVQTTVLVLLLAILGAALVVSARAIVRPLSRLAEVTRRISRGDWSPRARPKGVRELAQLAGAFNEMADSVERDLAARRHAEAEALEAEHRLQTIADRVPGAVFQFHVDGDGAFSVRFASRHGSIHRSDAEPQDVDFPGMARAVLPEDRGGWLDTMLAAARDGRSWHHEYRILTPEGRVAWMEGHALAAANRDGSAELYGYVADVTARKALEDDLRRAREDAEAADRAKSAFLALISHELRTPLVAVTGTLELLSLGALDARQRELVDVAMGSARALLDVIGDVLDVSKIEAGALDLAPVPTAVGRLAGEVVDQHRPAASARGLALDVVVDPAVAPGHVVDAVRLRQVLGNLVGNAIKFTGEGGAVVSVEALGGDGSSQTLALEVRDTGIGIAPEDQARLFVPFAQASTEHARSSEGAGLGLTICRQLVRAMGGEVTLHSAPDVGTTVRVVLTLELGDPAAASPGTDEASRPPALPPRDRAQAAAEGSLLLLVEDNPVNQRVLSGQLEAAGFHVDVAGDAGQALAAFERQAYGLVFTDIQLPHVDGYELAARLRRREDELGRGRTPVLALTASALLGELDRCRAAGMDGVVTKPATIATLARTLRTWLPDLAWVDGPGVALTDPDDPLWEVTRGDPELTAQVLGRYVRALRADLDALATALADGEGDAVRRLAHQIAGASQTVGAWDVAERAQRLEAEVRDGSHALLGGHYDALMDQIASSRLASSALSEAVSPRDTTSPASSSR